MYEFRSAIVRQPAATFADGLTARDTAGADHAGYLAEHRQYTAALQAAGLTVRSLPPLAIHPDAHFVEDVAVLTPEVTVLTRPGASSRRGEVAAIADELGSRATAVKSIAAPGTLDGGDVLIVGKSCFVGLSSRTNQAGADQLRAILEPLGYGCRTVAVRRGLHLKSSVTAVDLHTLVLTPALARQEATAAFATFRTVQTAPGEDDAANLLRINDWLLVPDGFPATCERLEALECTLVTIRLAETLRMDGGLTCLSLRF